MILIDEHEAVVEYLPNYLPPVERDLLFSEFDAAERQGQFKHDLIPMFGKTLKSPRLVTAFGDPGLRYRYAGVEHATRPWPDTLLLVRDRISALVSQPLNYALVNLYRDGDDYIGWHADNESDIVPDSCIASLSLGELRAFQLRRRNGGDVREVLLTHGSLLLMKGRTQRIFKHRLPTRPHSRKRFNVTFRWIRSRP